MKVLWLCNIMLPAFAKAQGLPYSAREGWLSGCYDRLTANHESEEDLTLGVCFPAPAPYCYGSKELDGVFFYGFSEDLDHPELYDPSLEERFTEILKDFDPDLVHIFGTEFPHSLAMLRAFGHPERSLVGIQGLCCQIAAHYLDGLPEEVVHSQTFRDRLKGDSLTQQRDKFLLRAANEQAALGLTGHVTGRTDFDRKECQRINPKALYHPMNETLRQDFYEGKWDMEETRPYSIFLSQGDYPLKGFHTLLSALALLLSDFPKAHVYVAGNSVIGRISRRTVTVKGEEKVRTRGSLVPLFIRIGAYGKYLRKLIAKHHLSRHVTVLGKLSALQMKEQYLKASLYVCPSAVENSPNSLGEAMLLGTPVVAARTGGIPSMLEEDKDGVLYTPGDVEGLAAGIRQIWEEKVITLVYSENERAHARKTHDPEANYRQLLAIYREIGTGTLQERDR